MDQVLREGAFIGQTHIVTGAAQGIGHAISRMLAGHGAHVVMVDLDAGRLEEARAELAGDAQVAPLIAQATSPTKRMSRRPWASRSKPTAASTAS